MINSKNLFENFEEIPIEKAHPNISTESLIDKQLFLFQIPKNFNPQNLNGLELDTNETQNLTFKEEEEPFDYVVEKMDSIGEKSFQDQVLILKANQGNSKHQPLKKKIAGVFRIYKNFNVKSKISKHSIIKTNPNSLKRSMR